MSVRGYFTLRNAIPGYSFTLILLILNAVPLIKILEIYQISDFLVASLTFFTLLSGSAVGFLISQIWWFYWQGHAGILGDKEYENTVKAFQEVYGINIPSKDQIRARRLVVSAMDYADHTKISRNHKELLTLTERRWDMFHTLSSTFVALILSLILGVFISVFSVFNANIKFRDHNLRNNFRINNFVIMCRLQGERMEPPNVSGFVRSNCKKFSSQIKYNTKSVSKINKSS